MAWPGIWEEAKFKIKINLNVSGYGTVGQSTDEPLNLFHQELSYYYTLMYFQ